MKWFVLAMALMLVGCLDDAPKEDAGPESDDTAEPKNQASAPASNPEPTVEELADEPETWYLHKDLTCEPGATLCNCGSYQFSMDRGGPASDCSSHGERSAVGQVQEGECDGMCFEASSDMGAFPVGAPVAGEVYITTDAADVIDLTLRLYSGEVEVGSARIEDVTVAGAGGYEFEKVPFQFTVESPTTGDVERFLIQVDAAVSYFVGFGDERPTHFVIGED